MIFIVNPSQHLRVVRQIAAVKIVSTTLAMMAGNLHVRGQSAAAPPVQQRRFELWVQRDQQLDHSGFRPNGVMVARS